MKDNSKTTMLTITVGFLVIFVIFQWPWALYTALSVGAIGILSNWLSRLIDKGWMKLAHILSLIIPSILLGVVFFFILFPLALLSRLFKKDPLMLSSKHISYYFSESRTFDKSSFEKSW